MFRRLMNIIIVSLALVIAAVPALPFYADGPESMPEDRTVRLGFFEFGGMFEGAADGAPKSGYCYEYMMEIAVYTGWNYEFCYGSYSELYDMLTNGEIDILPYTNFNERRGREVLFSDDALAREEYYIAVKSGSPFFAGGDISALNGKTVSTLEGADYNSLLLDYFSVNGIEADIRYYPSLSETWDAVENGIADATVFTSNAYSDTGYQYLCTFGEKPTYIAVAKDRPELLSQLDAAVKLIETESPELKGELYAKYFSDNPMLRGLTPEEQQWIDAHPVIHIGGFSGNPTDLQITDGKPSGLTVDIVEGMIEKLSLHVNADYRCYDTVEEMRKALEKGEIDAFYPFYPNYSIAGELGMIISNTVRVAGMDLVYKTGTDYNKALTRIASPAVRLGVFYVRDQFPECELIEAGSVADALEKVEKGEALGAVAYNQAVQQELEKYRDLSSTTLLGGCGTCFAAMPGNHALIMVLNRGLNYFSNGEISALSSKHALTPRVTTMEFLKTHKEVIYLIGIIVIILAALLAALLRVNYLKKKADGANKSKTAFLFNMSHDIRTPMNAILGYTDIAMNHVSESEKVADSLRKIKLSGNHLLNLINDILEMSRIEAGRLEIVTAPLNVYEATESIVSMSNTLASTKCISFTSEIGELKNSYLYADELHVNQIVVNLISNAIKYTNPGGSVNYRIEQTGEAADGTARFRFTVKDTGIGMSEEFQKHLFESFTRERTSTVSRQEGAGLGLTIVKRIVDRLGGTIEVRSRQGEGSVFTVELPLEVMDDAAAEEFRMSHNAGETSSVRSFRGKKVLLVEDNELNREIALELLEENGMIADSAEDGSAAVRKLKENGAYFYDFILMDIQMPVMNGFEATKAIREMYPYRHIPIVALSANAFAEDREASVAAGMDSHVSKPININELLEVLSEYL